MLSRLSSNIACKVLLNANVNSQKIATCRFGGLARRAKTISHKNNSVIDFHKHTNAVAVFCVRYQSTENAVPPVQPTPPTDVLNEIPDPPVLQVQDIVENVVKYHPNGEATFSSLGLGGYSPTGIVQNCLEFLHIGCDLPWWGAILAGTLCVRLMIFPLIIMMQKNAAQMSSCMPEIQQLQLKMTEARQCGNTYEASLYASELYQYMGKKKINPLKNFVVVLVQVPMFISIYYSLQTMTPIVDSLKTGGLWWFADLTVPDPYYVLPILTSLTLLATIEVGTDSASTHLLGTMRYFLRAMPFVILPFMINFNAIICTYWLSTNLISLVQAGVLRTPRIRRLLGIPEIKKHKPKDLPMKQGFIEGINNSWTNMKIASQLAERERADSIQFNNAARGPIKKTYKYDPTKQLPTGNAVHAKRR